VEYGLRWQNKGLLAPLVFSPGFAVWGGTETGGGYGAVVQLFPGTGIALIVSVITPPALHPNFPYGLVVEPDDHS